MELILLTNPFLSHSLSKSVNFSFSTLLMDKWLKFNFSLSTSLSTCFTFWLLYYFFLHPPYLHQWDDNNSVHDDELASTLDNLDFLSIVQKENPEKRSSDTNNLFSNCNQLIYLCDFFFFSYWTIPMNIII